MKIKLHGTMESFADSLKRYLLTSGVLHHNGDESRCDVCEETFLYEPTDPFVYCPYCGEVLINKSLQEYVVEAVAFAMKEDQQRDEAEDE